MIGLMHLPSRRVAAILLLAVTGGVVLAFLWERGQAAGSDAFAYWTAVQRWLSGQDIYHVTSEGALPFAYAPWSLYLFLPWAMLPWSVAWFGWRLVNIVLFALTVGWAYERRPLATALLLIVLAPPLAANLDTGNINVLIVLGVWLGWFAAERFGGARLGGVAWAIGTALKFLPAPLLLFVPRSGWRVGLAVLAVLVLLTLATWPQFVRQLDIVLNYPRPIRFDYLLLAWAAVPWLWARSWPPPWRDLGALRSWASSAATP
jgi:hypothetical protein